MAALSPALVDREQGKFRDAGSITQSRVAVTVEGTSAGAGGFSTLSPGMPAVVSVGVGSTQLLAANSVRGFAVISNNTAKTIYVQLGAAAVYGSGIRLSSGASLWLSGGDLWLGDVYGVTNSGTAAIDVNEVTT